MESSQQLMGGKTVKLFPITGDLRVVPACFTVILFMFRVSLVPNTNLGPNLGLISSYNIF